MYVSGVTRITMRTGPDVTHKIVSMVTSGVKLQILEYRKDWSMVKDSAGRTGWVLTRFLTDDVPKALLLERYKKENEQLASKLSAAEETANTLDTENKALKEIAQKYKKLKDASASYLKLETEHKALLRSPGNRKTVLKVLSNVLKVKSNSVCFPGPVFLLWG